MTKKISEMNLTDFVQYGFLQELNRQFLHPLGMALEVIMEDDGYNVKSLGKIWDYRQDPEGIFFADAALSKDKIQYVNSLKKSKIPKRIKVANDYDVSVGEDGLQIIKG